MIDKTQAVLGASFPLALDRPFTFSQALHAGVSRRSLRELVHEGLVRRMLKGVYVACQARDSQLLRAQALRLVVPDGLVVTDESAGWLAGASMILRPGAHLEVPPLTAFGTGGHDRVRNSLTASGTRHLSAGDVTEVHGITVTTPLRTALDLGRLRPKDRAIAALDQLLRTGAFTQRQLLDGIVRFKGFRGVRQLRIIAPLADGRSESPGESVLRLRFHELGLPAPEPQVKIFSPGGHFLARTDLALPGLRFVAEYDGERFHGPEQRDADELRRDALRAAGWTVVVVRKEHLTGGRAAVDDLLHDGIKTARRRLGTGLGEPERTDGPFRHQQV